MQANTISFTDRKVSHHAVFASILGGSLLAVHMLLILFSIVKKGTLPFASGVIESFLLLFSLFGLLWAVLHYDEERTTGKYKILGITLNAAALAVGIAVMGIGIFA